MLEQSFNWCRSRGVRLELMLAAMAVREDKIKSLSFLAISIGFALAGVLRLLPPLLTVLFAYLALDFLNRLLARKWLSISVFLLSLAAALWSLTRLGRLGAEMLPQAAAEILPALAAEGAKWGVSLPVSGADDLKKILLGDEDPAGALTHWLGIIARQTTLFFIAVTAAVSLFISGEADLDKGRHRVPHNLYSSLCHQVAVRCRRFYASFRRVMGAQLIISAINAPLTCVLLIFLQVPYPAFITAVTFAFGLLPTVGGVLSNTVTVCIALSVSPALAIKSLLCLIALHRLEYLLNTRIIGARIRNPMFLTLTALVVGERLAGIPGMILAPVILHYLKAESLEIPVIKTLTLVEEAEKKRLSARREARESF